jgi:leucyl-tRNA synthetase
MGYGTGAIMAVPAHDERDHEFADKFKLPIVEVIRKPKGSKGCYAGEGKVLNSGKYNAMLSPDMREKIVADLSAKKQGKEKINYKIHDWLISRQRYWGAPIPIIHCPKDGLVPVPEEDLPVVLPEVKSYEPSGDGRSPLANVKEFVNVKCPKCGGKAERETDTMDGFACSSWYFLRFADPHNSKKVFDSQKSKFWLPVDDYIGGAEHAVMHLLYARFWTKVMYDEKLIDFEEPFTTLRNQGMILAPDGQKMSKSKNNTIEPDELISQGYGADSIRLMELFIGPWNQSANWSTDGIGGTFHFLQRVWTLVQNFNNSKLENVPSSKSEQISTAATHFAIKKVSEDIHELKFNTAIATLMQLVNQLYITWAQVRPKKDKEIWRKNLTILIQLLAPFAPHIAEELWQDLGHEGLVHLSAWPVHDEKYLTSKTITIVVQVNGKVRANIEVAADASKEVIVDAAKSEPKVKSYLKKDIQKTIYVPGKLVNFVV